MPELTASSLQTNLLEIAFECGGPADGPRVLLLHGWPDDAGAWRGITPTLESAGYRWVAPWLRGFGRTQFLSRDTLRDGSAAALAQDALDLADALDWDRFSVIGHDWGGRAAYTMAAIAPEHLTSIASLAIGYSPRGRFVTPPFDQSLRWWYQWFMSTDGGARAVHDDPIGFARIQWETWSPAGWFDEATFASTAESFRNADWAHITLHGYRSRWKSEPMDPRYTELRQKIDAVEMLHVPTLMLQGGADYCDPPKESEGKDRFFPGGYERIVLDGVGHFPAREASGKVAHALVTHLNSNKSDG
jgi:pimeloyl-ACP methyl ester carboxylesterase